MYSLGFLPLIIFMRGVAGAALLLDIIQLRFFILQAAMSNKMAVISKFLWWWLVVSRSF
ncbi:hypothetical protein EMIT0P100_120015 [Pseudomonas sp. IT-P100]